MGMIDEIIQTAKKRSINASLFSKVTRIRYLPYDMNFCLKVVEAIGKERNHEFLIDQHNRFTYENLIRWVHGDTEFQCLDPVTKRIIPGNLNTGIYIAGNTGTGKSWALEVMSIYSTIDGDNGVMVYAGGIARPLRWESFRTDTIREEYMVTGIIEKYKKHAVIAFQDLGAEPTEALFMGNRENVMQQILEHRGDQTDQITLISSNLPITHEKLVEKYDSRVASRLCEMCNYFEIKGPDRRKKLK